jgi:hypothetical protein
MVGLPETPQARAWAKQSRIFTHPADVHCALYNLVVLACYATAF